METNTNSFENLCEEWYEDLINFDIKRPLCSNSCIFDEKYSDIFELKYQNKVNDYFENNKVVFTALFHIRRGSCCGNFCRHCPYEPKHLKGNTKLDDVWEKINQQKTKS